MHLCRACGRVLCPEAAHTFGVGIRCGHCNTHTHTSYKYFHKQQNITVFSSLITWSTNNTIQYNTIQCKEVRTGARPAPYCIRRGCGCHSGAPISASYPYRSWTTTDCHPDHLGDRNSNINKQITFDVFRMPPRSPGRQEQQYKQKKKYIDLFQKIKLYTCTKGLKCSTFLINMYSNK